MLDLLMLASHLPPRPRHRRRGSGLHLPDHPVALIDQKLAASACRTFVPEQLEDLESGLKLINDNVYTSQMRRTKNFGEPQPDIWAELQKPYVKLGEIKQAHDPATFLDSSFIQAANDWETDEVKKGMYAWKEANPDKLIP